MSNSAIASFRVKPKRIRDWALQVRAQSQPNEARIVRWYKLHQTLLIVGFIVSMVLAYQLRLTGVVPFPALALCLVIAVAIARLTYHSVRSKLSAAVTRRLSAQVVPGPQSELVTSLMRRLAGELATGKTFHIKLARLLLQAEPAKSGGIKRRRYRRQVTWELLFRPAADWVIRIRHFRTLEEWNKSTGKRHKPREKLAQRLIVRVEAPGQNPAQYDGNLPAFVEVEDTSNPQSRVKEGRLEVRYSLPVRRNAGVGLIHLDGLGPDTFKRPLAGYSVSLENVSLAAIAASTRLAAQLCRQGAK